MGYLGGVDTVSSFDAVEYGVGSGGITKQRRRVLCYY